MTYLLYNGSFEGFLSAVFDAYDLKLATVQFRKEEDYLPDLFAHKIYSIFDEEKYKRVRKKLTEILGTDGVNKLWKVTLSELQEVEDVLWEVIQYALKTKTNVLKDYGHPYVLSLNNILKKISRERHRMLAFVRFKLATDGVYYATIEPDFNVLPLIANHFKNRYADQPWFIYDSRRNYGLYYDLNHIYPLEIETDKNASNKQDIMLTVDWDNTEKEFQKLWQNYFKATNIKARKNSKLHLQYVPKRYWRYLTEKN